MQGRTLPFTDSKLLFKFAAFLFVRSLNNIANCYFPPSKKGETAEYAGVHSCKVAIPSFDYQRKFLADSNNWTIVAFREAERCVCTPPSRRKRVPEEGTLLVF